MSVTEQELQKDSRCVFKLRILPHPRGFAHEGTHGFFFFIVVTVLGSEVSDSSLHLLILCQDVPCFHLFSSLSE